MNVYGELLCEDCWDEYICTPRGKVEYLIGINNGDYSASEFDDEFLKELAKTWDEYKEVVRPYISAVLFVSLDHKAAVFHKL
jgi:hypothetical protein